MAQTVEAVLISGPRRGEIVELSEDQVDAWTDSDIDLLNQALDKVIVALDRLSSEMDLTVEAFQQHQEAA